MKNELKMTLLSTALAAMMLPAAAQTATPTVPAPTPNTTNAAAARQENQQDRIANGIKDGELNDREAAGLESRQAQLDREVQQMRAANGGKLTAADRAKIDKQQAALSKAITSQSTDAQKLNTSPTSPLGKRNQQQQDRIAQGIASGQLTPGEASRLERNDTRIAKEIRNGRSENGGTLTSAERQHINQQDNRVSRQIYRAKHNGKRY